MHKAQLYRILIVVAIVVTFGISVFAAISAVTAPAPTNTNTNTINVNSPPAQAVKAVSYTHINRCSREALVALPGIGEVLADRIIAGRPYADVYELDRVDGIGPGIIAELSGKVVAE